MPEKSNTPMRKMNKRVEQETSSRQPQYVIVLLFIVFIVTIVCVIFWQKNIALEEKMKIANNSIAASESLAFVSQAASQEVATAQENMDDFKSKHDKILETDVEQYWEISSLKEQNAVLVNNVQALKQYNDKLETGAMALSHRISELESELSNLRSRLYSLERETSEASEVSSYTSE